MDDTITWLKAQIDEDERIAKAVPFSQAGHWHGEAKRGYCGDDFSVVTDSGSAAVGPGYEGGGAWGAEVRDHIATHDPERALREVKAKRRIITEWEEAHRMAEADPTDVSARVARFSFAIALQALYGVYSDRPGWIEGLSLS